GVTDVQNYVDADSGSDAGNGSPAHPFRTIEHALATLPIPAAAQIEAVCFAGIFNSVRLVPPHSGAAGAVTIPPSGSQDYSFELPRYPLVISGWDRNDNGQYPPYDTSDVAVLDGNSAGDTALAIANDLGASNLEVAHFSARDYGVGAACDDSVPHGFMAF